MKKTLFFILLLSVTGLYTPEKTTAQQGLTQSQMFRLGEGIIRIAEPGQLADSVNVWGNSSTQGRYLVPRGTNLVEMISYGRGTAGGFDNVTNLDWSDVRMDIYVTRFNRDTNQEELHKFRYQYGEPLSRDIWLFTLRNNDQVSIEMKRRRTIVDYLGRYSGAITSVVGVILIYDRFR